jgi:hypothetical protein
MQSALRITSVGWLAAAISIFAGSLLLGTSTAAADHGGPHPAAWAFGNAPGCVSVNWDYPPDSFVAYFTVTRENPYWVWDPISAEQRNFPDCGLQPSTTYRYRVCAFYYDGSVACSGPDWAEGITLAPNVHLPPPPPRSGGSSGDTSPPPAARPVPQPLHSPVIRARPSRLVPAGPPVVHLAWVNPLNAQQHALLTTMDWYRDGVFIGNASTLEYEDAVPANATHRYKICIENPVNRICSAEISAGPAGVAASFESLNVAGHFIRHRFSLGEITRLTSGLDFADATFILRPGLTGAPGTVSFESVNYRGQYLRHQNYRIKLSDDDGSDLFRQDATFVVQPGLSGTPGTISFESVNFPGHFIRHQNFELWMANKDAGNISLFPLDASFWQQLGRSASP